MTDQSVLMTRFSNALTRAPLVVAMIRHAHRQQAVSRQYEAPNAPRAAPGGLC
jgi:hypothetical protein